VSFFRGRIRIPKKVLQGYSLPTSSFLRRYSMGFDGMSHPPALPGPIATRVTVTFAFPGHRGVSLGHGVVFPSFRFPLYKPFPSRGLQESTLFLLSRRGNERAPPLDPPATSALRTKSQRKSRLPPPAFTDSHRDRDRYSFFLHLFPLRG